MEFISQSCEKLTGYPAENLIGNSETSYTDLIHPDDRQAIWDGVQKALDQKTSYELEYRILTWQKQEKWVWEKGSGRFSEQNELLCLEGFITDITERNRVKEALQARNNEMEIFNKAAVGRELRMIELKKEINTLCRKFDAPEIYL